MAVAMTHRRAKLLFYPIELLHVDAMRQERDHGLGGRVSEELVEDGVDRAWVVGDDSGVDKRAGRLATGVDELVQRYAYLLLVGDKDNVRLHLQLVEVHRHLVQHDGDQRVARQVEELTLSPEGMADERGLSLVLYSADSSLVGPVRG